MTQMFKEQQIKHLRELACWLARCPKMYAESPREFQSLVFGITAAIPELNIVDIWCDSCNKEYHSGNKMPNWDSIGFENTVKFCCSVLGKIINEYENEDNKE